MSMDLLVACRRGLIQCLPCLIRWGMPASLLCRRLDSADSWAGCGGALIRPRLAITAGVTGRSACCLPVLLAESEAIRIPPFAAAAAINPPSAAHCVKKANGKISDVKAVYIGIRNWETDMPSQYEYRKVTVSSREGCQPCGGHMALFAACVSPPVLVPR